jgi:hypothetical protein
MSVPLFPIMFKPINSGQPAELSSQPGLEYWFKERRTVNDFRRGPLGSHFDGFAAYLKAEGYSCSRATEILGKCCQLNAFLVDRGLTRCEELSESVIDSFLDVSLKNVRTTASSYSPRANARGCLKRCPPILGVEFRCRLAASRPRSHTRRAG